MIEYELLLEGSNATTEQVFLTKINKGLLKKLIILVFKDVKCRKSNSSQNTQFKIKKIFTEGKRAV